MGMSGSTRGLAAAPLVAAAILAGCAEPPAERPETVRAVRTVTVTEPASGRVRRFSGVVEAADASSISFEVSGVVESIESDVGDRVSAGQALATIDRGAYELNVEAARAALSRAEVELQDARTSYERLRRIAEEDIGATSERALDQAEAARDSALQGRRYAASRLDLARRDLERTSLVAPFDAVVAERHVDAFQQVERGQKIFDLFMEGAMEAAIRVPESEVERIRLGLPGEIRLPAIATERFSGIVTEIGERAGAGNAFPVRLTIATEDARVRPGLTAEVSVLLDDEPADPAYLVPLEALAATPGASAGESASHVFRYDAATSTVRMTPVETAGIRESNVVVASGLSAGDVVVVAGVSFLRDGQKVKLMR